MLFASFHILFGLFREIELVNIGHLGFTWISTYTFTSVRFYLFCRPINIFHWVIPKQLYNGLRRCACTSFCSLNVFFFLQIFISNSFFSFSLWAMCCCYIGYAMTQSAKYAWVYIVLLWIFLSFSPFNSAKSYQANQN